MLDMQTINPAHAKVKMVMYYMQTMFQPQSMIFTPEFGLESREFTIKRELKELQFEDGYIGDLPTGMQEGRLGISIAGALSFDTTQRLILRLQKICNDVSDELEEKGPELLSQFIIAARAAILPKKEMITSFHVPFISKRPLDRHAFELFAQRITDELASFKTNQCYLLELKYTKASENLYGISLSFRGKINQKQFDAICNEIDYRASLFDNIEFNTDRLQMIYDYRNGRLRNSTITFQITAKTCEDFIEQLQKELERAFPSV